LRDIERLIRAPIAATDRRGNPSSGPQTQISRPHQPHQKNKHRRGRNHRGEGQGHGHHQGRPAHGEGRHHAPSTGERPASGQPHSGGDLNGVAFLHRKRDHRSAQGRTDGPNGARRHSR
jgi:hypothetical protein